MKNPTFVWLAEAPGIPGYYLAEERHRPTTKLGEQTEFGTYVAQHARRFTTKAECEAWITANPSPAWKATEHGFY